MLELIVAGSLVVAIFAATSRSRSLRTDSPPKDESVIADSEVDLPCPWCLAPTAENDQRCPSCGQRFG